MRYGLIAGNGRFPELALESARQLGHDVTVIAIQEEAPKSLEALAPRCYWISLGQLSKLIDILKKEGLTEVVMCGQVKHAKIFSSIVPDWRLLKLLAALPSKNTDGLIGGVIKVLEDEGIHLSDSTALLKPMLATAGPMTSRKAEKDETVDIAYGRRVADALAGFDVGQSVAICERACVALEAMEGTDAMLRRAAALVNGRRLSLVKVARRREHLLFDVPVVGLGTIPVMRETGTTVLAVEAGRTLLLDREEMLRDANPAQYKPAAGIEYPNNEFGNNMKQIAQLLKSNLGVEAAFTDVGGWDTHQNQGGVNGQLSDRLREFSTAITAFWRDMGDAAENVTVVTMSEFGRTARENGTGGTDHGHANAMFVLGGAVKGGRVYGRWPGLANGQLNEGRDLAVTTDFRQVLGEAVAKSIGVRNLELVFPGAQLRQDRFLRII